MGHDITPLGNHSLDTRNIHSLASDLSKRLEMNIEYGYYGNSAQLKLLGLPPTDEFVVLDSLYFKNNKESIRLTDEAYLGKLLVKKFGKDILYTPGYWDYLFDDKVSQEMIDHEIKNLNMVRYSVDQTTGETTNFMNIYDDHYHNSMVYYRRWWGLCRFFIDGDYDLKSYLDHFNDFRKELRTYTNKLGGDKMYYIDDQSEYLNGVGQGDEAEYNWTDLEQFIRKKTGHLMLDIPQFMTDTRYRKEFLSLDEYPLSFVDDFRDLKNNSKL